MGKVNITYQVNLNNKINVGEGSFPVFSFLIQLQEDHVIMSEKIT
jgi:hypothetical protein